MQRVRKVVIPAAGLGTRLLPHSKAVPKELLPVLDKPGIHHVVDEALQSGIEQIILVLSPGKEAVLRYFQRDAELEQSLLSPGKERELEAVRRAAALHDSVISVLQEKPLGLGHAVLMAKQAVGNEPFAVILPDDIVEGEFPAIGQLIRVFEETGKSCAGLMEVPREETRRYGVIGGATSSRPIPGLEKLRHHHERLYEVSAMMEKPRVEDAPSNMAIIGRYVFLPEIFTCLERTPRGAGNEIQLTDSMHLLLESHGFFGWEIHGHRHDAGDHRGYLKTQLRLAARDPELREEMRRLLARHGDGT
ncbi:MAG: UTP--glucose-1-phosphate uridylyltransferase [Myxococcota bacterium]|nr:UTP--glucose-1-phosphate uridylyltransferase [Myxococcota bacterium]